MNNKNIDDNNSSTLRECVICLFYSANCKFLPCGHISCCFGCGLRLRFREDAGKCPICRKKVKIVEKIYK